MNAVNDRKLKNRPKPQIRKKRAKTNAQKATECVELVQSQLLTTIAHVCLGLYLYTPEIKTRIDPVTADRSQYHPVAISSVMGMRQSGGAGTGGKGWAWDKYSMVCTSVGSRVFFLVLYDRFKTDKSRDSPYGVPVRVLLSSAPQTPKPPGNSDYDGSTRSRLNDLEFRGPGGPKVISH